MADYGWFRISPTSGTEGTHTISVAAVSINYGRGFRSKRITISGNRGAVRGIVATQSGHAEYVTMGLQSKRINTSNTYAYIEGVSNSQSINVSFASGGGQRLTLVKIEVSTDGGMTWTEAQNNTNISGDPGQTDEYMFRIKVNVGLATSGDTVRVTAEGHGGESGYTDVVFN